MKQILWLLVVGLVGCKTVGTKKIEKSYVTNEAPEGHPCQLEETWAGKMGFRLSDHQDGAQIDCVVIGQGLHHIGLKEGDIITQLNTKVVSSPDSFEKTARALAGDISDAYYYWTFEVSRSGNSQTVGPDIANYPGCSKFLFDDCGPLFQ